jgi:hypothetical protein
MFVVPRGGAFIVLETLLPTAGIFLLYCGYGDYEIKKFERYGHIVSYSHKNNNFPVENNNSKPMNIFAEKVANSYMRSSQLFLYDNLLPAGYITCVGNERRIFGFYEGGIV